ncbi:hypothetical protein OAI07_00715 [Akkermansiaceae bacterium]|nr:hypothetical protein [Akkermansiaceae bacterium]
MKAISIRIITILLALLLWPFSITALLSYFISGMKFNRWISSVSALGLVLISRILSGKWIITLGGRLNLGESHAWYLEILFGFFSWSLAAIIVAAFVQSTVKSVTELQNSKNHTD